VLKRSSKSKGGGHPVVFKLKAIKRVQRGEGVSLVARDLGMTRMAPDDWLRAFKAKPVMNRTPGA
jgi:transposase